MASGLDLDAVWRDALLALVTGFAAPPVGGRQPAAGG
jgi:hypothetical protein